MKSIRWKLVFMYLTLVFIVMLVSGTFIIISINRQENDKARDELVQYASYIEEQIINQYSPDDFQQGFTNFIVSISSARNIRGHILDANGKTLASSTATDTSGLQDYNNSAIISAINGKASFNSGRKGYDQNSQVKEWISYASPVFSRTEPDKVNYIVFVQLDATTIKSGINRTIGTICIAVLLALLLTSLLGILFAGTITDPIAILTRKANLLAKGRLEQHVAVKSNDEIGQLTRSFNIMAKELRKTLTEMESQNNKLEIIMHNMTDGILAFDERGVLLHANKICYEMLDIDEVKISLTWLLNKLGIDKNAISDKAADIDVTIEENGKYINVNLIPYTVSRRNINGIIAVLHDITKHQQLDDMRKEFVANVSHEIGTPLTTVMGYTDLLLDGAIDDKELAMGFLKEISTAAERMKLLRDDLLDLSRFDTKVNKFNKTIINLVDLIESCVRQNIIVATNKRQTITFDKPDEEMLIFADTARISQVLTNIVSNAMKYSPEDSAIKITVEEKKHSYYVNIIDNGIGMPKEALTRIFDRFYRVDKARSRAMGGNGLGLSIAKEIMDAHHGMIHAYSELGKGTTMVLIFPKYTDL